jgi:uncharacterized protein DUF4331
MKPRAFTGLAVIAALLLGFALYAGNGGRASDHQDSPVTLGRPGADITDPYIFPAPDNPNNVVLVMNVHPFIPSGQGLTAFFDPGVVYQMNFDGVDENAAAPTSNITQSFVLQFVAGTPGSNQPIVAYGPAKPLVTGNKTELVGMSGQGTINSTFTAGRIAMRAAPRRVVYRNSETARVRKASTTPVPITSKASTRSRSSLKCRAPI